MRRPLRSTALAAALLLTGCASHTAAPSRAAAPATPSLPGTGADHGDPTTVPTGPAPGALAPEDVASMAVGVFCDHDPDPGHWWDTLAPHLSPQARTAYAGTDPATVPCHQVTGPPTPTDAGTTALARVQIPTDAGGYVVLESLTDAATWQVERITPADDQ